MCYPTLLAVFNNMNELRKAEYGGATRAVALFPTIGALKFGTSNDERWTLPTVLPFGGIFAMMLSFGGSIMPPQVEDHVLAIRKSSLALSSTLGERISNGLDETSRMTRLTHFVDKLEVTVRERIDRGSFYSHHRVLASNIVVGLVVMLALFVSAQIAMTIVIPGLLHIVKASSNLHTLSHLFESASVPQCISSAPHQL
jgi:hypothetical protein